ncbi:QRFP-like peptide receptor [Centruroides sculpturatus]|uniref:QRFP-like peptide receptor n=1 Tax=Centruroides sculpturatus TaxID=218467 RepID=UPI000C6D0B6D|nr:QRFP-like peptide receptor [Centruroides sculpturatus]
MDYSSILIKVWCTIYHLVQDQSNGKFQDIIQHHAENMTILDVMDLISFYKSISPGYTRKSSELLSSWSKNVFVIIFSLFSVASIITNSASCYVAICYRKTAASLCYFFAFSLAISDLLQTIATFLPEVNNVMNDMMWKLGYWTCNVLPFVQVTCTVASSLTLCFIAIGRYLAVVHAMRCKSVQNSKISIYVVVIIWIIGICMGIPSLIIYKIYQNIKTKVSIPRLLYSQFSSSKQVQTYCVIDDDIFGYLGTRVYIYIVPAVSFLPLFLIITILYCYVGYYLWMRKPVGDIQTLERSDSNIKKKKRIVKTLVTLIALYFICRFPICSYNLKIGTKLVSAESNQISTNATRSTVIPRSINVQEFDRT